MIKRVLLFMCGSFTTSTGTLLFVLPKLLEENEVKITVLSFLRADLYLAMILCFVIGGIAVMGKAIVGEE